MLQDCTSLLILLKVSIIVFRVFSNNLLISSSVNPSVDIAGNASTITRPRNNQLIICILILIFTHK